MPFASHPGPLDVHTFPRPPVLERCLRHVRVVLGGVTLAASDDAHWVLETTHPPTYYIPPQDCQMRYFTPNERSSYCEWKGRASYFDVTLGGMCIEARCWAYNTPTAPFLTIKDYLAFYASPFDCFVDDEKVIAQPGDFYGGWMTADIHGGKRGVKGGPGTAGW